MSATDDEVEDIPKDKENVRKKSNVEETDKLHKPESSNKEGGVTQSEDIKTKPKPQENKEQTREEVKDEKEVVTDYENLQEEEQSNEEEELVEEEELSVYDPNDFISGPRLSEHGTLPMNILEFNHSYGYNCRKYFNMVVIDDNTVVFGSGNYINFVNIETGEVKFRRSALGGGIGHLRKNPNPEYSHLAIAESGDNPIIILYEWPSMEIYCVLREGTTRSYNNIDYSPSGMLLASQGGEPDHNITIWKWTMRRILLRVKSNVNDVFRVKFSPYVPGQLTTCGLAHIKFWKMAETFTGLKLKGELGRFGKTEYSDIVGILPMPDEKIVSGCYWGNILIWDDGLIKLEVMRSQRKPCHTAPVMQFLLHEGNLWSVSMDGHIKVWWYEKIDQADPPDEDRVVLMEPTYDFYTQGVMLMCIEKRLPGDSENTKYMAQDGNGGIWEIDVNTDNKPSDSKQIFKCHGGKVVDICACPHDHYFATIGEDGRIYVYDYLLKQRIIEKEWESKGCCMIWLPISIQPSGDQIIVAFSDGLVRICVVYLEDNPEENVERKINVLKTIKPHSKPITKMSINPTGKVLVTAAEDSTIFILKLEHDDDNISTSLEPIGFMNTPDIVTCITWHLQNDLIVLLGCRHGSMMEVEVPCEPQDYTSVTYLLKSYPKTNKFHTYKSQIRRDIHLKEIKAKKAAKVAKKKVKLAALLKENPGMIIDEEIFLADSESEEELEPLHIPEVPNDILWLKYTENGTIWLSMAGYDAGYIYEYYIDQMDTKPKSFKMIHDGDDIEISSYLYNYNKKYLVFAMQDGSIRVNRVNEDFTDLSDYWIFPMHDNLNGFVPSMCFSYDEKYFFSCGHDGNVFQYKFDPEYYPNKKDWEISHAKQRTVFIKVSSSMVMEEKWSLEEAKLRAEEDRINRLAHMRKTQLREQIKSLQTRYQNILERNSKLLPSQIIPKHELIVDHRIEDHINQQMTEKIDLVKRKLSYPVEKSAVRLQKFMGFVLDNLDLFPIRVRGINNDESVMSMRQRKLPEDLEELKQKVAQKIAEDEIQGRTKERQLIADIEPMKKIEHDEHLEYFLLGLSQEMIEKKLGTKLTRMLKKYRDRNSKWKKRSIMWEEFQDKKPKPNKNHPDDEKAYATAQLEIGDYKLKTAEDYKKPPHLKETTVRKFQQVLESREKQFTMKHEIALKVYDFRKEKYEIIEEIKTEEAKLYEIHTEIAENMRKYPPEFQKYDETEFPEKEWEITVVMEKETENFGFEEEWEEEDLGVFKTHFIPRPTPDQLEAELLPAREVLPQISEYGYYDLKDKLEEINSVEQRNREQLQSICADACLIRDTPYEYELRIQRLNRKLYEQDRILESINSKISYVNNKLKSLKKDTLDVLVKSNVLDLHVLSLNQELIVLKKFEENENNLEKEVKGNETAVLDMRDDIKTLKMKISNLNKMNEDYQSVMEKIFQNFNQSAQNNKFYDFLKKVFKKKYKPPKVKKDDDDSSSDSSSSSSSEDSEEEGSVDSRDFNIIKQDLNVCPKGCDPAMYDYTITLRSQRYEYEQSIRENEKIMEVHKKEVDILKKKSKQLENVFENSKEKLISYQREKQSQLNQIMCLVMLTLKQMQIYNDPNRAYNIEETVIFSKPILTKLYKRVAILQRENLKEKEKHTQYIKHLMRMKRDFEYMDAQIKDWKRTINTEMIQKFGKRVDIDTLQLSILKKTIGNEVNTMEEVLMKKLILDCKLKDTDVKKMLRQQILVLEKAVEQVEFNLITLVKKNSVLTQILTSIKGKKNQMNIKIYKQDSKRERIRKFGILVKRDEDELKSLQDIIDNQDATIQALKIDIQHFRAKGLPPRQEKEGPKKEEILEDFVEYEKYLVDDEAVEEEKPFTEIIIPDTYVSTEAEDIIRDLLRDMFDDLDVEISRKATEDIVREILRHIMQCTSVHDIIKGIVDNLPLDPSRTELKIIESTAEKLIALQEPEVTEEDLGVCIEELIEDIIDETMLNKGEPHEVMARTVLKLIDSIPQAYLLKKEYSDLILNKLDKTISLASIKSDIIDEAKKISDKRGEQVRVVIECLLDKITEDDAYFMIKDQLDEALDEVLFMEGDTYEVMLKVIDDLVQSIPMKYLTMQQSLTTIVDKFKERIELIKHPPEKISIPKEINKKHLEVVKSIMDIILNQVFGEGLDYFYVINK